MNFAAAQRQVDTFQNLGISDSYMQILYFKRTHVFADSSLERPNTAVRSSQCQQVRRAVQGSISSSKRWLRVMTKVQLPCPSIMQSS